MVNGNASFYQLATYEAVDGSLTFDSIGGGKITGSIDGTFSYISEPTVYDDLFTLSARVVGSFRREGLLGRRPLGRDGEWWATLAKRRGVAGDPWGETGSGGRPLGRDGEWRATRGRGLRFGARLRNLTPRLRGVPVRIGPTFVGPCGLGMWPLLP